MSRRLLKSTAVVGAMTLVSRILGFARDMVVARMFGAGAGSDAFFVAFKIPNFLRRLFAEGSFSQAFVPVLSEVKAREGDKAVRELVADVSGTLGGVLFLITALGVVAAPFMIMVFAPGFVDEPAKHGLAAEMLRLTFPYLLFISLTALAGGVLNSYGRFAIPAITPVFLNLSLIGAALWLSPHLEEPVTALAWGVFIAGVVQLAFQLPYLARLGLLRWPRWAWYHQGVQKILKLMLPAILGSSVAQINLLLDTVLASLLVTGSVSWLYYSDRLVEFPLGVFGIALATVILPSLSKNHAEKSPEEFARTLDWGLRWVMLIGTPAALGLFLLAGPMLSTLFQYGEFTPADVVMASYSLMAYSAGLMGFMLVKVLAPAYYARQDTTTPMKIGVKAMVANMVLNVAFTAPLVVYHIPGAHAGLAAATAVSAFLNAWLLYRGLHKTGVYRPGSGWGKFFLRLVGANLAMGSLLWWGGGDLSRWFAMHAGARAGELALWVGLAIVVYFAALFATGVRKGDLLMRRA